MRPGRQTDTCIGDWHYKKGIQYKTAKKVIDLLVDIVSKNGNLLLNFPLPASGRLDADEHAVLQGITDWMAVNSEAIYSTRPWKVFGEGPSLAVHAGGGMNETRVPDLTAADVRYTTKQGVLYAMVQGWPTGGLQLQALGSASPYSPGRVHSVEMLGASSRVSFEQTSDHLRLTIAESERPSASIGVAFRIRSA